MSFDIDVVIIGVGIVGLVIGYVIFCCGLEMVIIEQEVGIGQGVLFWNFEVIYVGIYYLVRLLKVKLCVVGKQMLYVFCDKYWVFYSCCGKLVVVMMMEEELWLDVILV